MDVVKGVELFSKVGIPTVAVVENMSGLKFTTLQAQAEAIISKHQLSDDAANDLRRLLDEEQPVFGKSHVPQLKDMWGIAASFSLPLLPDVARSSDDGVPLVLSSPGSDAAKMYRELAAAVDKEVTGLSRRVLPQLMYSASEQQVLIALPDGSLQRIKPHDLRRLCRSPSNDASNLPADLYPLDCVPMGNYAVSVRWSDGHQSLLPYASFVEGF